MNRTSVWAIVVGVSMATAGCAKAPTADIDVAQQAITGAETAEAGTYAADEYRAAQEAQAELQAELAAQDNKFSLTRSYDKATELAAAAKAAGEAAQQKAAAEKDRVRQEATQLLADSRVALEQARELLAKAPRGKGTQADLAVMKTDLDTAEATLTEADAALAAGDFAGARNKGQTARDAVSAVASAVEQARTVRLARR